MRVYWFDKSSLSKYSAGAMRGFASLLLGVGLWAGTAAAEGEGTGGPDPAVGVAGANDAQPVGTEGEGVAAPSPVQMRGEAQNFVVEISDAHKRVSVLETEASDSRDIVLLNCVSKKKDEIKDRLSDASSAFQEMSTAVDAGNGEFALSKYKSIRESRDKALDLQKQAEKCKGEKSILSSDTEITYEEDPSQFGDKDQTDGKPGESVTLPPFATES